MRAMPIAGPLWIFRLRIWYNSTLESTNFIVPGLIAVMMMVIAGPADFAHRGARVGDGHHGATAFDAGARR
jgi:hypothetical protein